MRAPRTFGGLSAFYSCDYADLVRGDRGRTPHATDRHRDSAPTGRRRRGLGQQRERAKPFVAGRPERGVRARSRPHGSARCARESAHGSPTASRVEVHPRDLHWLRARARLSAIPLGPGRARALHRKRDPAHGPVDHRSNAARRTGDPSLYAVRATRGQTLALRGLRLRPVRRRRNICNRS